MKKITLGIFFILLTSSLSYAAGLSIRLENSNIKLSIPAGSSKAGSIKVYNQENDDVAVKIYLEDWAYTSELDGTKAFSPAGSTPYSCADWITFYPQELTIPAYGVKEVNYVVKAPADAVGGHYAVMFFETTVVNPPQGQPSEEVRSGVGLAIRLGMLYFVEVKDGLRRQAQLSNLIMEKGPEGGYLISCDFKNTGNTYINSVASYHLMNNEGVVLARGEFNRLYAFPADAGKLTSRWNDEIPDGTYDLILTLDLGKAQEEAGIGRGPVLVQEAQVVISAGGKAIKVGPLK